MLHLCSGNQLEHLADQLISDLAKPVTDLLEPELVVVPGQCFDRWLSLRIAQQKNICANISWQLPADLIWHLFRATLSSVPTRNAFSADVLAWRIFEILSDNNFVKRHSSLLNYLASEDPWQTWQLAKRLGLVYEQYLIYRPDWILDWQQRKPKHWQSELWNWLISNGHNRHWLVLQKELLSLFNDDSSILDKLPNRISFFALPTLSVAYLELLQVLSKHIDVMIYHHNFSKAYWIDTNPDIERTEQFIFPEDTFVHRFEEGNSLLLTMGRQGREQLIGLMQLDAIETEVFQEPATSGLLGHIQSNVFEFKDRTENDRFEIVSDDCSLEIHVCYGIMREIEVLHDQLLNILQDDEMLSTADILVLVPELEVYGPYIEAVFGSASGDRYLPWQIKQSGSADCYVLIEVFFMLLDLPSSRFEADKITMLIEQKDFRRRFGLSEADGQQVLRWIRETGIAWGVDESEVCELEVSTRYKQTWQAGMDRLLLGHALGNINTLFLGILPSAPPDGEHLQLVGQLATIVERLSLLRENLKKSRKMDEWVGISNTILEDFFEFENEEQNVACLQDCFTAISKDISTSTYGLEVPLVVFREALKEKLNGKTPIQLMSGSIRFSKLSYGQVLPAEVVCVLGLNGDAFPRRAARYSFDQIQHEPRLGDRRSSDEDRHIFLEALLSARRKLYFSYVGKDLHDDTESLPSILLCELMDYIDRTCVAAETEVASKALTIHHPLQAFSKRYFDKTEVKLFSYVNDWLPSTKNQKKEGRSLFPSVLRPINGESISSEKLASFFANPARMFLRDRLGVNLDLQLIATAREVISVDELTRRRMAEQILEARLNDEPYEIIAGRIHGAGYIPVGTPGDLFLENEWNRLSKLVDRLRASLTGSSQREVETDVVVNDIRLQGNIENLTSRGLIRYSASSPSSYELLNFWISHLIVHSLVEQEKNSSRLLTPTRILTLSSMTNAFELLHDLISLYKQGMQGALGFFPRSAWAYVKAAHDKTLAAQREWHGSDYKIGENENIYFSLVFRDKQNVILSEEFQRLAERVYGPLNDYLVEEGLL